jgi:hypothetical protein
MLLKSTYENTYKKACILLTPNTAKSSAVVARPSALGTTMAPLRKQQNRLRQADSKHLSLPNKFSEEFPIKANIMAIVSKNGA